MCFSWWGIWGLEAAAMFVWGLYNGTATFTIIWFKLCPVPGNVNGWGCGLFRCAQHVAPLVWICFCYKPDFRNLWLCVEAEFLVCSLCSGLSVEHEGCVYETPANQASNGSQMRLPCSFTAVSPIAALCCQHRELSFISVTIKKQKYRSWSENLLRLICSCPQGIAIANFKTREE